MATTCLHFTCNSSFFSSLSGSKSHVSSQFDKPMRITMANCGSYWASINADVEAHLERFIPIHPPLCIVEPMHHFIFAAPRNMAPALCIATCELVGGHKDQAVAAASALHLMHAASFTHEQLLFFHQPNPNHEACQEFDSNIKLLIGDAISPLGYELLARSNDPASNDSDQVLRVIIEITHMMGPQGMVNDQYLQVCSSGSSNGNGWIDRACEKKEAGLYACGAKCGAILGRGSEEEIYKLKTFGLYVGMIHGMMLCEVGGVDERLVGRLRSLALKELEGFKKRNVEAISSLLEYSSIETCLV